MEEICSKYKYNMSNSEKKTECQLARFTCTPESNNSRNINTVQL